MKILILSFSANMVDEESFVSNKIGLTFSCVNNCEKVIKQLHYDCKHICINKKNIKKCMACGPGGWGICWDEHRCTMNDDFNEIYNLMKDYDAYIFITPVYFSEMSESAKTYFDRLKRCDSFNKDSKIKNKRVICIACAGGSGNGTDETLKSFDILCKFLNITIIGRIPITKKNFEKQLPFIETAIKNFQ